MPNSQFSYISYWRYWQYHQKLCCFRAPYSTNYEGTFVPKDSFFYLKYVLPMLQTTIIIQRKKRDK